MKKLWSRARSLWRGIRRRDDVETEMSDEFLHHLDQRAADLERRGLSRAEARRQARLDFGSLEHHKHESRGSRGLLRIDDLRWSWIDVKLGVRMLRKHPGLTLVGGLGLAVAITIAATANSMIDSVLYADLPVDEGDRVVSIQNVDTKSGSPRDGTHLHDLPVWRTAAPAIADFGAYRIVSRNLIAGKERVDVVRVVEMSASGFQIARVAPLMGRYIVAGDEHASADPVVVLGHSVWQGRFAADPLIVGKSVQLGSAIHTIVGVMPDGFAFPVNNRYWTALRVRDADFPPGEAPSLAVFGRLAPGATLALAQAQLDAAAERLATASPETHRDLRTEAGQYSRITLEGDVNFTLQVARLVVTLLLIVIGTNVAVLVYARTAARAGEITLRTALGASRLRVITQFFAEALVLAAGAALLGLEATRLILVRLDVIRLRIAGEEIPYWMMFRLTPWTFVFVAGLAVLAAVIVGAIPAIKATGSGVLESLRRIGGGGAGLRLGKGWTLMIILQVAVTVALLPIVVGGSVAWVSWTLAQPNLPTGDFVTATLVLDAADSTRPTDADSAARSARLLSLQRELFSRLGQEPNVAAVLRMSAVPGEEPVMAMELDAIGGPQGSTGLRASAARASVDHFSTFEVPLVAGRTFTTQDLTPAPTAVIVNEGFAKRILGDANPVGRRIRLGPVSRGVQTDSPWLEIVGVVQNFPTAIDSRYVAPRVYLPLRPDDASGATIAVRARDGNAAGLVGHVRDIAASVDPTLRLARLETLDASLANQQSILFMMLLAAAIVAGSTLLLSCAGIYALISLTVTRRHREIALRVALGAEPRRVIGSILSRALGQIAIGIVLGVLGAIPLAVLDYRGIVVVAVVMMLVGIGAAIGPARRCLRIQPTEALKAE